MTNDEKKDIEKNEDVNENSNFLYYPVFVLAGITFGTIINNIAIGIALGSSLALLLCLKKN